MSKSSSHTHADLAIELNGRVYPDMALIQITDVATSDGALLCRTDRTDCCGTGSGELRQGEWFYPDGTLVRTDHRGANDSFYRNRHTGIVRLNRRNGTTGPTGLYCCEVASVADPDARICVELSKYKIHRLARDEILV